MKAPPSVDRCARGSYAGALWCNHEHADPRFFADDRHVADGAVFSFEYRISKHDA